MAILEFELSLEDLVTCLKSKHIPFNIDGFAYKKTDESKLYFALRDLTNFDINIFEKYIQENNITVKMFGKVKNNTGLYSMKNQLLGIKFCFENKEQACLFKLCVI
jgi:hypothetical protein